MSPSGAPVGPVQGTWETESVMKLATYECHILWYCMQVYEHSFEAPVRKCIYKLNFSSSMNNCKHRQNNNYRIGKIGATRFADTGKHAR